MLNLIEKQIALCERFSINKSFEWYQHRFFPVPNAKTELLGLSQRSSPKSKLTLGFFVSEKFFFKLNYIRFLLVVNNS